MKLALFYSKYTIVAMFFQFLYTGRCVMTYSRDEISRVPRDELERGYFQVTDERDFFKKRVDELMRTIAWIHSLMRSKFPPREKIYLYGQNCEEKEIEPEENGLYHIPRARIADKYGLSESQVGDSMKLLAGKGIIEKKTPYRTNEKTGKTERVNFVALGDSIKKNPKATDFQEDNNWGGKRTKKSCNHCGSEELMIHSQTICTQCGSQVKDEWKTIGEHDHTENNSEAEN